MENIGEEDSFGGHVENDNIDAAKGNANNKKRNALDGDEAQETDFTDEKAKKQMNLAKFILKTSAYEALLFEDEIADTFDVVKTKSPISHLMFPIVTKAIKSGSRSERAYISWSDYDFIYEIGPLLVDDYREKPITNVRTNTLWYKETNHVGFYTVCDGDERYLTPVGLQNKVAYQTKDVKYVRISDLFRCTLLYIIIRGDNFAISRKKITPIAFILLGAE